MSVPRSEHPRPQFMRDDWECLNGTWAFEVDNGRSGIARGLWKEDAMLAQNINVPFCPQSELSGVGVKDFMYGLWYQRKINVDAAHTAGHVFIHFGAVDYRALLFVNGQAVGEHKGGYISFSFEITDYLRVGENTITLYAEDDERDPLIPRGKQSEEYFSHACDYTRTSGIWQSVWLEYTPPKYIRKIRITPSINACAFFVEAEFSGTGNFTITASYQGKEMARADMCVTSDRVFFMLPLKEKHLWEAGHGRLYDLELSFGEDLVRSYAGLREVALSGKKFLLNGKSVFQRLVLDQGFYPDGIYTASSDEALVHDIEMSMSCGFNGARLHEKVFEERFLYHCDRLGYMVWGEFPNWGLDHSRADAVFSVLFPWLEELERDYNHPSIIGWCPFNETKPTQCDDVLRSVFFVTKSVDKTRPVIDTSGFYHVCTDIYDVHDYEQDVITFKSHYENLAADKTLWDGAHERWNKKSSERRQVYDGEKPVFISEYGGIGFGLNKGAWAYGKGPKTGDEFIARFKGLADAMLDNPEIMGFCYTQLTDIEQEQNGLFTYEREPKFSVETLCKILSRKAAIED